MLAKMYPYVYLAVIASAVLWYMLNHKKANATFAKIAFWLSTALYIPVVLFADGSLLYKAYVVPRDFLLLAGTVIIGNALLKFPKALFVFIIGLIAGMNFFYMENVLKPTFVFNSELDQEAELMFDIKSERQLSKIKSDLEAYDLEIEKAFPELKNNEYSELDDYYVVNVPNKHADKLDEIIEALEATNSVDFIDENEIIRLSPQENEEIEMQRGKIDYGINDPSVGKQWAFDRMNVADFYKYIRSQKIKPKKRAKVAILDTGVDAEHEDIKGTFTSTNKRYDRDVQGHGTHCAGIAGAISNNGKGIASLSLDKKWTTITSVKVLSDRGVGSQKSIIQGIIKAADSKADVISMSLGGPSFGRRHRAYEEAIKYARNSGAIVVVAAGNSNQDARRHVPAACKGVITVAATGADMDRAPFSNYVTHLDMGIAAPGVNILSTLPKNKYAPLSGTSMATPYVAGLLGIMKSIKPDLTTEQAYRILNETGVDTKDPKKTGKFIQPANVLKALK